MAKENKNQEDLNPPGFRNVPKTGVIYVMSKARELGYSQDNSEWANLGQGAPETGIIPNAPERLLSFKMSCDDLEYAPVAGLMELREAVANLYNQRYRKNKKSQYTAENVAICSGGRLAVTRAVSALGRSNIGHFLPDYTAYEELLDCFNTFVPIPILLDIKKNFEFEPEKLKEEILGRGLSSLLISNPSNPTGKLISGEKLKSWVDISRALNCSMIFDEFYSHYIYNSGNEPLSNSAAEYVEDVNSDPIIVIDGLTKNWRYPGFRVSWTLAPKQIINAVSSAGSFIDGGCPRPIQMAVPPLLSLDVANQEAQAIQECFKEKREFMLSELEKLGIKVNPAPEGGFYCWGDISGLDGELRHCMHFFKKALEHKVITVPGVFFDINPGQRRPDRQSRFNNFVRFSFGPELKSLKLGIASLAKMLGK